MFIALTILAIIVTLFVFAIGFAATATAINQLFRD